MCVCRKKKVRERRGQEIDTARAVIQGQSNLPQPVEVAYSRVHRSLSEQAELLRHRTSPHPWSVMNQNDHLQSQRRGRILNRKTL